MVLFLVLESLPDRMRRSYVIFVSRAISITTNLEDYDGGTVIFYQSIIPVIAVLAIKL